VGERVYNVEGGLVVIEAFLSLKLFRVDMGPLFISKHPLSCCGFRGLINRRLMIFSMV
jgi:hypothetical protein